MYNLGLDELGKYFKDGFLRKEDSMNEISIASTTSKTWTLGDILPNGIPLNTSTGAIFFRYGSHELRNAIIESQRYKIDPENLLLTKGTMQANFLVVNRIVKPGDEVIIELPTWMQIHSLCEAIGANIKILNRKEENDWNLDIDELNELVTRNTKFIFINSPNNPTGALFDSTDMKKITEIASDADAYFLSDEEYRGMEWDGNWSPSAVHYYEKAISTCSVSKALGMDGVKVGWMATQDLELREKCMTLKYNCTGSMLSHMDEVIALAALRRYDELAAKGIEIGKKRIDTVDQWMSEQKYMSWVRPKSGYVALPKYDADVNSVEFCKRLAEKPYQVRLCPGNTYRVEQHVRIGATPNISQLILERGLGKLDAFLKSLN